MENNKKDLEDANSAGATAGVLIGLVLWWFDVVGIWGAFAVMIVVGLLVSGIITETKKEKDKENDGFGTEFDNWEDIAKQQELKKQEQEEKAEQNKIMLDTLKWGLKWGGGISAFLMLVGMLSDENKTSLWIILLSFVLLAALIGLGLFLIRIVWLAIKGTLEDRKKENEISDHFKNMPKPRRKIIAGPPQKDDDFNLPGYGVTVWKSSKGLPINFNYVDSSGEYSERTVIIHEMTKDSKTRFYFHGHCLLRRATRTFNSENIQDIYDMNGEIIEVPEFINKLAGYEAYGSAEIQEVAKKPKKKKQS